MSRPELAVAFVELFQDYVYARSRQYVDWRQSNASFSDFVHWLSENKNHLDA